jgi:murein DD-endopeptidase MepM/ murein hydrolase activator NlpD
MSWIRAVEGRITDSFEGHKNRKTPSRNPGTDYGVATGTPVKAINDGMITGTVETFRGAGGRMIFQSLPGGHNADYLHLSRIDVQTGQEVKAGQIIGLSGGSGLGSETGYGPHLHLSFRRGGTPTMAVGNIDYEAFLSSNGVAPSAPATPKPASAPKATKPKAEPKPKAKGKTYKVVSGDNLTKIAKAHGTTVAALVKLNGIKDKNLINVGQVLKVS